MKKILSILTSITLITSSSTTVVACGASHTSALAYHNGLLNLSNINFDSNFLKSNFKVGADISVFTNKVLSFELQAVQYIVKKYNIAKSSALYKGLESGVIILISNFKFFDKNGKQFSQGKLESGDKVIFTIGETKIFVNSKYIKGSKTITYTVVSTAGNNK